MTRVEPRITILSKLLIFTAAAVILSNYYYLYFVGFSEGESEGSPLFSMLKIIGIILICAAMLRPALKTKYSAEDLTLLSLLLLATIIFIIKSVAIGISDMMFLNAVICTIPFLCFKERQNNGRIIFFFESCLFIMLLQIALETYIYSNDMSIWHNKAFVGGLGNPSSFGLVCNILIAYILFKRKPRLSSVLYFFALACGVLMTSSMLSSLALGLVLFSWGFRKLSAKKIIWVTMIAVIMPTLAITLAPDHLLYKVNSALYIFDDSQSSDSSRSVSLRLEIHNIYADNLSKSPVEGLFYGFTDSSYMKYDSQILTYLSSFGIIFSMLFFFTTTFIMVSNYIKANLFPAVCLLLFSVTFLTNRILDYYPLPIFFAITLFAARYSIGGREKKEAKRQQAIEVIPAAQQ